jgi:hypothetical protein
MSGCDAPSPCPSTIQTAAGLSTIHGIGTSLRFDANEREALRGLAAQLRECAEQSTENRKRKLWRSHNDLETTEPVIFADPENGWNEILTQDLLVCSDPLARVWEMHLRKELFWNREMRDDKVTEPCLRVPYSYTDSGWGLREVKIGGEDGGSYAWQPPIIDFETDFQRLRYPEITIDHGQSERVFEAAHELFDGILEVRHEGPFWWTLGLTWDFINLRGLTRFMMDLYENPEWVKRLMAFLSDGTLRKLSFLESEGVLAGNHDGMYVGSGGFGYTDDLPSAGYDPDHVQLRDMWGFAESQETVGISPEMFAEFVLPFQVPILERFGLNCYGCCEPIDPRWKYVKTIPRLRRVSVSPWADREASARNLGRDYILSLKPSPTPLASPDMNEELVRHELRRDLERVKNCIVEIVMKDNHTLGGNPRNITRWVEIAREEVDRAYS